MTQVSIFKKLLVNTRLHMVGPTIAGLAIIPALPLVDEPIEHIIDRAFEQYWPQEGGSSHAHGGFAASGAGKKAPGQSQGSKKKEE